MQRVPPRVLSVPSHGAGPGSAVSGAVPAAVGCAARANRGGEELKALLPSRAESERGLSTGIPNVAGNGRIYRKTVPGCGWMRGAAAVCGSSSAAGDGRGCRLCTGAGGPQGTTMPTLSPVRCTAPASPCSDRPSPLPAPAPCCWREQDTWPWALPPRGTGLSQPGAVG